MELRDDRGPLPDGRAHPLGEQRRGVPVLVEELDDLGVADLRNRSRSAPRDGG
jgi:hypothetical protein